MHRHRISQRRLPRLQRHQPGNRVLLYLNCNNTFATAGVPGNSIGSPEGRAARADYEEKQAQAQAEAQQSESTELEQTGNVPGEAGQVAGG